MLGKVSDQPSRLRSLIRIVRGIQLKTNQFVKNESCINQTRHQAVRGFGIGSGIVEITHQIKCHGYNPKSKNPIFGVRLI